MNASPIFEHFDLNNEPAYAQWREWKIAAYPKQLSDLIVEIDHPDRLSASEKAALQLHLDRHNMVIYRSLDVAESPKIPLQICARFGLKTLDGNIGADQGVTSIEVKATGRHGRYIPYTSNKLSWHTDGYYNRLDKQIRAMVLHCVRPAKMGGENDLIDPEMAYIYLRDLDPEFITVLSQADVMTIPANELEGKVLRSEQTGPVFSFDAQGYLHMRYSARKRNIIWKDAPKVTEAAVALAGFCEQDARWRLSGALAPGEGLICNNVLHNRRAFEEDEAEPRLLYRLRYYERIQTQDHILRA